MYPTILIPLENSWADDTIIGHIRPLARLFGSRLILLHVADGFGARNYDLLNLAESEEMRQDRAYLEIRANALRESGFEVETVLALGDPAEEIVKYVKGGRVDLIAMATHGHRFVSDIVLGSAAEKVRHLVDVPVLLLKAKSRNAPHNPPKKSN